MYVSCHPVQQLCHWVWPRWGAYLINKFFVFFGSLYAERSSLNWVTYAERGGWEILRALRILISLFSKESSSVIWVEMRHLPGRQSRCVLAGSTAVGEWAIIGISLDVTSPALSADPALTKNCFAHHWTPQRLLEAKDKDIHVLNINIKQDLGFRPSIMVS